MQLNSRVSLNSVRVFVEVAKSQSISLAASTLNVTPSAVSHQVKNLEKTIGISLFTRKNNSVRLTRSGVLLFTQASKAINIIENSIEKLNRDESEISLKVAMSFAVRWLIPALEDFKQQHPLAKIRVETFHHPGIVDNEDADMVIVYRRIMDQSNPGTAILEDFSRPVISPKLLAQCNYKSKDDLSNIPALICTQDNWDWQYWQQQMGIDSGTLNFAHRFDSDDAAIHAAVAGLGMVLATPLATRAELNIGSLVEMPFFKPLLTGAFCMIPGSRKTKLISEFEHWLTSSLIRQA